MILILGGGLAGLSLAYHLGERRHLVLEAEEEPGGLCRTREVDGFHFDRTGHLLHLRDPRAIALVDELSPGVFREISRRAFVRCRGATLPFPFQAHLHELPRELVADCLIGFAEALAAPRASGARASFRDWSLSVFGRGISEIFMFPYNAKVFGRDASEMTADWVSWAVPRPTSREVVRGALGLENPDMGYNARFRYPERGGIGVLPAALARRVPHLRCRSRVEAVDLEARTARLEGGDVLEYEHLAVTIPLPAFLRMTVNGPPGLAALADRLDWSAVACLNLGIERTGVGQGAHWIYFPDPSAPFYRVGFPTNFSGGVAPAGTSSMYVEFGLRRGEPADTSALEAPALDALRREGILERSDRIVVRDWIRIDPAYVIFDRARQEVLARVVPALAKMGVHLLGRYGAWTYSYMERALLDGMELAARLQGRPAEAPDA